MSHARTINKLGVLLACIFFAFGAVNIVSPMDIQVFQVTCGRRMFFWCHLPPQELTRFEARLFGIASVAISAGIAWLSWQKISGTPTNRSDRRAARVAKFRRQASKK